MTKGNLLSRIMLAGSLAASSLLYQGCEDLEVEMAPSAQTAITAAGFETMANDPTRNPEQRRSARTLANLLYLQSQQQAMKEAAEAGRPNVEQRVYVQPPQREQQPPHVYPNPPEPTTREPPRFFTCLDWEDRNKDDIANYDEYVGIKSIFKPNEGIKIVSVWYNKKGKKARVIVEDSRGNVVFSRKELIPEDGWVVGEDDEKFYPKKQGKGIEKYVAKWFLDDVFVPKSVTEFYVDYSTK